MSNSNVESEIGNWSLSPSQMVELKGSGLMEINNLTLFESTSATNQYCQYCRTYGCQRPGQSGHSPPEIVKEIKVSANSFYKKGGLTWELSGEGCFSFNNKFIHLEVKLLPSYIHKKYCKLILALKCCPSGVKLELNEIQEALVTLFFLDKENEAIIKKCIRIKELNISMDEKVFTSEFLGHVCHLHPDGVERNSSYGPVTLEHEFVSVYVQLQILLKPEVGVSEFLNPSSCKSIQQDQVSVKALLPALNEVASTSEVDMKNCNQGKEKATAVNLFESKNMMTAVAKTAPKFSSKFADLVTIKCGCSLEHTLSIHKEVLTENSPVFRSMLSTKMSEAETGEIKMPTVSPEVVEAFICFLYKTKDVDWIEGNVELMIGVLELAHTYQIPDLISDCTQRLVSKRNDGLNIKSVLQLYSCGHTLNISDLQCRALQWFMENKQKITPSEQQAALAEFLQNENTSAVSLFIQLQSGFHLDP